MLNRQRMKLSAMSVLVAAVVAACGGGGGGDSVVSIVPPGTGTPPPNTMAKCSWDASAKLAYEERRLATPLPYSTASVVGIDERPLADRIVKDTGFDQFAPNFSAKLCGSDGRTSVAGYDAAVTLVKSEGAALWRAAVDRVQGRRASPAGSQLPNSDDRMLYWARVQMTKVLRQWAPEFALSDAQKASLQWEFERASRGQYDIELPEGNAPSGGKYRRMIVSGFDTFTLGALGTPNTGLRNGNPSGATALEMDGREITLDDGSVLHVESYVLPVSYDPFHAGMQEDTLGPWFKAGPKRVDASITMSQGSANVFNLEQWNARYHGPSAGNDGIIYCPVGNRLPKYVLPIGTITVPNTAPISMPGSGCDTNPQSRWLGYDAISAWLKEAPPQFTTSSLPIAAMVTGKTGAGVARPPGATSEGADGFDVTWHTNYAYFADCDNEAGTSVASNGVMNAMPDPSLVKAPPATACAQSGGGGNYLSNESAYRNTLLRDTFKLDIPAGHIHVPVMTNFFTAATGGVPDDNAMTDARFEAYRTAIVAQTKKLLVVIGNNLK